jgi:hypothetical protein
LAFSCCGWLAAYCTKLAFPRVERYARVLAVAANGSPQITLLAVLWFSTLLAWKFIIDVAHTSAMAQHWILSLVPPHLLHVT